MSAPDKIWLQLYGDGSPDDGDVDYKDGVTWCWEKIYEHDIEYVRADKVAALELKLAEAEKVLLFLHEAISEGEKYNLLYPNYLIGSTLVEFKNTIIASVNGRAGG